MFTILSAAPVSQPVKLTISSKDIKTKAPTQSLNGILKTAKSYLGTKYRYGGTSRKGVDCSGFTRAVFKRHNKNLPRTSRSQATVGKRISKKNLRRGDLVFFSSRRTRSVAHVGIALGNGKFIHASSGKKRVIISSLSNKYYRKHYITSRRI